MTGMSMLGRMSAGMVTIDERPSRRIRIEATTNVYGRSSASLTIHINEISLLRGGLEMPFPNRSSLGYLVNPSNVWQQADVLLLRPFRYLRSRAPFHDDALGRSQVRRRRRLTYA